MKKNKIIFKSLILCIVSITLLVSCNIEKETDEISDTNKELNSIMNSLDGKVEKFTSSDNFKMFFEKWAKDNNIKILSSKKNHIILASLPQNYEENKITLLNCEFNNKQSIKEQSEALSTVLYLLKQSNTKNIGPIKALFSCNYNDSDDTLNDIESEFIESNYLINILGSNKTYFYSGYASTEDFLFTKDVELVSPSCSNAFSLSISNLRGGNSGDTSMHPNPIKVIGDFLAYAKSQGCIIELVSFNGGSNTCDFAKEAKAVFLINDNDVSKFERWYSKSSKRFKKQYSDLENDYIYTFEPAEIPDKVISQDDSTAIFTFIYTMINGVYSKEEGNIAATCNISKVSTDNMKLELNTCLRSINTDILEEMHLLFTTISGLNDVNFELMHKTSSWVQNENSTLLNLFNEAFKSLSNKSIKQKVSMYTSPFTFVDSENTDVMSLSVNFDKGTKEVLALQKLLYKIYFVEEAPDK